MGLAVQQAYSRSAQILTTLQASQGGDLVALYQPALVTPWDRTNTLRFYGYISDLRCKIDIRSIPETQLPNIDLNSSRTQRITAIHDQEWNQQRYELEILMKTTYSGGWHVIAAKSLLNRRPFYIVDLLGLFSNQVAYSIAADAVLGVRIRDAGYGFLQGDDSVTIFGAAKEEALALPTESPEITSTSDSSPTIGGTSVPVLPANPHRKVASLVNRSADRIIYLSYAPIAQLNQGFCIYPNGGALNIDQTNLYKGAIAAIADGPGAALSISEGV